MRSQKARRSTKQAGSTRSVLSQKKREFLRAAKRVRSAVFDDDPNSGNSQELQSTWIKAVQKLCGRHNVRLPVSFKSLRYPHVAGEQDIEILTQEISHALQNIELERRVEDTIL